MNALFSNYKILKTEEFEYPPIEPFKNATVFYHFYIDNSAPEKNTRKEIYLLFRYQK